MGKEIVTVQKELVSWMTSKINSQEFSKKFPERYIDYKNIITYLFSAIEGEQALTQYYLEILQQPDFIKNLNINRETKAGLIVFKMLKECIDDLQLKVVPQSTIASLQNTWYEIKLWGDLSNEFQTLYNETEHIIKLLIYSLTCRLAKFK